MKSVMLPVIFLFIFAGCTSFSFHVKEDHLSRQFMDEKFGNRSGIWYIQIVGDAQELSEYVDAYRAMIKKYPVMNMSEDEANARLKDIRFEKYQYMIFSIPTADPVVNLYDNYQFSMTDSAGTNIDIADSMYLTANFDSQNTPRHRSCWIIKLKNPLTKKYFSQGSLPIDLLIADPLKNHLEIMIGF